MEGARIAICARDEEELQTAEKEFASIGADVFAPVCGLRDRHQVNLMIAHVLQRFGHIGMLINNAGVICDQCGAA